MFPGHVQVGSHVLYRRAIDQVRLGFHQQAVALLGVHPADIPGLPVPDPKVLIGKHRANGIELNKVFI